MNNFVCSRVSVRTIGMGLLPKNMQKALLQCFPPIITFFCQPSVCELSYVNEAEWERFCDWTRYHLQDKRPTTYLICTGQVKVKMLCRIQKIIKLHQKKKSVNGILCGLYYIINGKSVWYRPTMAIFQFIFAHIEKGFVSCVPESKFRINGKKWA